MTDTKTIVCLANSNRDGKSCVAGKEVLGAGRYGEWIRPVNAQYGDAISSKDMQFEGGGFPQVLDVISIPLREHAPKPPQTENYQIDVGKPWTKHDTLDQQELPKLLDEARYGIWLIHGSKNDRVPASRSDEVRGSLLLIRPESLTINAESKRKFRANFRYNGLDYDLVVTDPFAKIRYAPKSPAISAQYQIATSDVYLCLSLAGPFSARPSGYRYFKLVAAIIGDHD